jgi:radical SAM/Cys-rich protein
MEEAARAPRCADFAARLEEDRTPLVRRRLDTVQANVGKLCNQACKHCHVDAGPWRTELMTRETMEAVLGFAHDAGTSLLDITGGAPEMNPDFRWLVEAARKNELKVMDRCNLTVLGEPGQGDTHEFLAAHEVQVVASLPCYLEENVDKQRGGDVFRRSLEGLRRLNEVGYGDGESGLVLTLVYNPVGAHLPPPQEKLEADYKRVLAEEYGVVFDQLFTITNMPIHRFAEDLRRKGELDEYMDTLVAAHNPAAVANVMCTSMVSVGWDGVLYDCDFNQMLEMSLEGDGGPLRIQEATPGQVLAHRIAVGDHCFGCTAGAGSSCGGAIV